MPIREIDTQMLDTESWKTNTRSGRGEVPHSSEKDDCVHERSPLMNLDWKHHAQSEEHRRRTLLAMEEVVYSAMTADLPSIQSQSAYSPDSSKDPMVKALPMFVHSFAGVSEAEPFFQGMVHWLKAQLGEAYACRWCIRWQEIAQTHDVDFVKAAILLLRLYCRDHSNVKPNLPKPASLVGPDCESARMPTRCVDCPLSLENFGLATMSSLLLFAIVPADIACHDRDCEGFVALRTQLTYFASNFGS
eukprot:CAMPEP_0114239346 /NCGR_PEP_ID=MMETSP0058-20121206/8409_1 /TAXON_ID=36894 /ORGANISM="Pyramimonas parkeae, CCMP726" /LENGTH=246 /DNA_ID=CAMNT_0001351517 /DNA_START=311 /DNA_END=1051 /DNA_ORIENTATION=+